MDKRKKTRDRKPTEQICKSLNGSLQWADDGVLTVCVKPRSQYDESTITLYQAKDHIIADESPPNTKQSYVNYFMTVYPSTKKSMWNKMSVSQLRELYNNLEIWYNYPNVPNDTQPTRAAFKPFYRVPSGVNLQQYLKERKSYPSNTWVEVFHAGNMNANFYIPPELYAGTFYYAAKGSGVFLQMGKSLIALNKLDALRKLKVPNDIIKSVAGKAFNRWLVRAEKALKIKYPDKSPEEISKIALNTQITDMASGKNSITASEGICYYGLGDTGDHLLATIAVQEGYDTIQLVNEAQLGCDERGVLDGFEIIDLRNPLESASRLRTIIPDDYPSKIAGYYEGK